MPNISGAWFWEIETISFTVAFVITMIYLSKGKKKKELKHIKIAQSVAGGYILLYTVLANPASEAHYPYLAILILLNIAVHKAEFILLWELDKNKQNTDL